jgi:hypothetical protein
VGRQNSLTQKKKVKAMHIQDRPPLSHSGSTAGVSRQASQGFCRKKCGMDGLFLGAALVGLGEIGSRLHDFTFLVCNLTMRLTK